MNVYQHFCTSNCAEHKRKLLFTNKEYEQAQRFLAHQEDEDRDCLPAVPDEDAPECCGRDES